MPLATRAEPSRWTPYRKTLPLECSSEINSLGKRLARVYTRHSHFLGTLAKIKQTKRLYFLTQQSIQWSELLVLWIWCFSLLTKMDYVLFKKRCQQSLFGKHSVSTITLLYYSNDNLRACKTTALFTNNITVISRQLLHKATGLRPCSNSSVLWNTLRFRCLNQNLFKKRRGSRRRHCTGYVCNKL